MTFIWKLRLAKAGLAALFSTAASLVLAQAPAQPRDPNMPDPKTVPAEKVAPDAGATGSTQTLSKKLEQSDGVIKPPVIGDNAMTVPAPPNPTTMPVIRPPGTSSSDPVQPK